MVTTEINAVYTPLKANSSSLSSSKKALGLLVTLLMISSISFAVLFVRERNKKNCINRDEDTSTKNDDVCLTPYCIQTASRLLENMDETVDPCENFYQFTCGNWMKNTKIASNSEIESSTHTLHAKMYDAIIDLLSSSELNETELPQSTVNARRLYRSCVNENSLVDEDMDPFLLSLKEQFFSWLTSSNSTFDELNFYLAELLLKFNEYNTFFFYQVKTTLDFDNLETLKYRIRITPGHIRHKDDDDELLFEGREKFFKYFQDPTSTVATNQSTSVDSHRFEEFQSELNDNLKWTNIPYESGDIITTVKNLTKLINTTFDFSNYVRRLYQLENVNLTDDDIVVVAKIENIRKISDILIRYSPKIIFTYMITRFARAQYFHLSKRLRAMVKETSISESTAEDSRELACAKYVNRHMGFAVSKLYIKKYFDRTAREEAIELVENIRATFIEMIRKSSWMDDVSKQGTEEKAQAIHAKIGYPAYLNEENPTKLEKMYAEYQFNSSHINNVFRLLRIILKQNLLKLREVFVREEWSLVTPTTINAFYFPLLNDIIFPAAILQPPFFHKDAPKYMNYGAIGTTIGHEITHGFDEMRRYLDKDRRNFTVWSNETTEIYNKRSKCLIDQYNNYTISQINRTVDGNNTLDENISDNDGLKKAFYAYEKWRKTHETLEQKLPGLTKYSRRQMFFISFAQIWCSKTTNDYVRLQLSYADHAPHSFRLIGTTSNFIEFDRAFKCQPGQGNSRANKCTVW